ncbi:MAG: TetR/AcrR family transcriptional regulator [Novosphingobium sp.]
MSSAAAPLIPLRTRQRSPGRPRDATRDDAILRETLAILEEKGFAGLTLDAVAARARASKATIYRRWATKEELAIAAFDRLPEMERPDTGSLEADVHAYVEQYTHFVQTTALRAVLPALVSEAMHNADLAAKLRATVARRREQGIAMIRAAIDRGELPPGTDATLVQELIIAPMLHRSFFEPDTIAVEDFRVIARIVMAGVRGYARDD